MAADSTGERAYIGSFTTAGGSGVSTLERDPGTGGLTLLGSSDEVPDPSFLALSPDGTLLYAVSETDEGAVAAFRTAGDSPQLLARPVAVGGSGPTYLSLFGGHVLTANYVSGSVSAVRIGDDGSLVSPASGALVHEGSGPHPQRQQGPHAHQVQPDPSGTWAVAIDLGTDSALICRVDDARGPLLHREVALRPGSGPRHLAWHPSGRLAYVINELTPSVTVCRWDSAEGNLQPLTETDLLPHAPAGDALGSGIVVAPDGRHLWTATRGEDVISVYSLAGDGEHPELTGTVGCGGNWPRDLALAPGGRHLYATNERSGNVAWFAVDDESGTPHRLGSVDAPAASCIVFA